MPIVEEPVVREEGEWSTVSWPLSGPTQLPPPALEFRVASEFRDFLSRRSDAAMLGLLVPSMESGEDLVLRGAVSPRLLSSLNGVVQDKLLLVMPHLRRIRIAAATLSDQPERAPSAQLTGFSAGGDSLFTLLRPRAPSEPRPTHLVNLNVGGHGEGAAADRIFRLRLARLREAARETGLPLVPVDSNLRRFHGAKANFLATVIVRNAAAILAVQSGAAGFEFSNAYHTSRQGVLLKGDISRIEDELLPLLSTETLAMRTTGSERTRVEKMLLVTSHPVAERHLDVCQKPRDARGWTNCGRCLKCGRALLFLEITGRLERFGQVFDLRRARRLRWWNHAFFLSGSPDMRRELEALAAERGFRFSRAGHLFSKPGFHQLGYLAQRLIARLP